ncbi:MAG: MOSC domain-containing protein [Pseudomonadota bacterium]
MKVDGLFVGKIQRLASEGQPTGIYKTSTQNVQVNSNGIAGDQHADRSVHGGPEKAVHQIGWACYRMISEKFAHLRDQLRPGALGENIFSTCMDDSNVSIGDRFQIGSVVLEVCQPRQPCWKINHKFNDDRLARFIGEANIAGWYFRVLEPGLIALGDSIVRIEKGRGAVSVAEFQCLMGSRRLSECDFDRLLTIPGLAGDWQRRILQRRAYFRSRSLRGE